MWDLIISFFGDIIFLNTPADFQGFFGKVTVATWIKILLMIPWYLLNLLVLLIGIWLLFSNFWVYGLIGVLFGLVLTFISVQETRVIRFAAHRRKLNKQA